MNELAIIGRKSPLFTKDLKRYENEISDIVVQSKFLVIGGGGSIGQAVSKELYKRKAKALHIVDLNEALGNGSNMLDYALNPNTLKQIES